MSSPSPASDGIVYGVRAVIEAVRAARPIDKILIQRGMNKSLFYELKDALANQHYPLQFVPIHKLNRITRKNHQGVIAQIAPVTYYELAAVVTQCFEEGKMPLVLLLDRLTDVRNFGAIARTAICSGVQAIVLPQRDSVSVTADAIKTSAGALHQLPVCKVADLSATVCELKQMGVQVVAASEKATNTIDQVDLTVPTAVVVGGEERGISTKLLAASDVRARIPIEGPIASLNASVAAGVLLYECNRQRMTSS